MTVNALQALLALALIFLLPGFFLVKAVFPRHRFSADLHGVTMLFLTLVASVSVTILVTGALAWWPGGGRFTGAATGAPAIEAALGAVTLAFAAVALARGAFPRVLDRRQDGTAAPEAAAGALAERVADEARRAR